MKDNGTSLVNIVEFAQEGKNPTLVKLNKTKNESEKQKDIIEKQLEEYELELKDCEKKISILENGNDYIDKIKQLNDSKYDDFLKTLNVKSFNPENIATTVENEYNKTKEEIIKKISELKKLIDENKLLITKYNDEISKLADDISDYKMKLKPLVELLLLSSDDNATNRERAEEVIEVFDELKKYKRDLCAKIVFPDTKFRNSIKKAFKSDNEKLEEKEEKSDSKTTIADIFNDVDEINKQKDEPIFDKEDSVDESVVFDDFISSSEKEDNVPANDDSIFQDIIIPTIDKEENENKDLIDKEETESKDSSLVQQVLDVFEKNKINYSDKIEEFSNLEEYKALNIMKIFDILSDKGIPLSVLRYSTESLLNVDPDKFNMLLNDFLSVKPKNDVAFAVSALISSSIDINATKDAIITDSSKPITEIVQTYNYNEYDEIFGKAM